MKAVFCTSHTSAGGRLTKRSTSPQTPLVPVFGPRSIGQRVEAAAAAAAFSLKAELAQGPFSFISDRLAMTNFSRPDVPKAQAPTSRAAPAPATLQPNESTDVAGTGKPRFRSALEQVSYYTNQSAMRDL